MIRLFLKARHWQVFLFSYGVPMLLYLGVFIGIFILAAVNRSGEPQLMIKFLIFSPVLSMLFFGVIFGWFWSVGVGLRQMIPEEFRMKSGWFKFFFFYPLLYLPMVLVLFFIVFISGQRGTSFNPAFIAIIFPFHLFAMFSMLYVMYFTSKTLKTAEVQRPVELSEFIGDLLLIWFFPIGIWFLQPRINQLYKKDRTGHTKPQHA